MPDNIANEPLLAADHRRNSQKLPVVGIGASAGGLEAFKSFFAKMPPDAGMAYVLVPHLDPGHKSLMVEIIGRHTAMPVVQVEDRMKIEPNHIYIIPPDRNLVVENDELVTCEISKARGINLPVDVFFRSLAVGCKESAIGIILSGTMRDGAMGLKDIKEHGGLVIAQDPETAQQDGMPQSAIDTGMVDFILPIEEMPEAILKFIAHPYIHGETRPEDQDELNQVLAVIQTRCRHDFRCYKRNTLVRRIERRMGLRQIERMTDYVEILKSSAKETDALLKDLLIGVTGFFREEEVWEKVRNEILPPMIHDLGPETSLRVWIPGCSTGEEAFTIALLIHDAFEEANKRFNAHIFATDIDEQAIATARKGIYPETIAANLPSHYLEKYFTREDAEYHILKRVRESVVFAVQNLVGDAPFSNLNLISCRNLLIYLNPEIQKKVIELFYFSLLEQGCLVLGNSETIGYHHDIFKTVSKELRIYRRIGARDERTHIPIMSYSGRYRRGMPTARIDLPRLNMTLLMQTQLLQRFAPAAVLVDRNFEIMNLHGPTSQYLNLPQGEPVMELASMVKEGLRLKLRAAIHKAAKKNETITVPDARVKRSGRFSPVILTVSPIMEKELPGPLYLITFQDRPLPVPEVDRPAEPDLGEETLVRQLEAELLDTREDLQSTIEELETSNEELKASNEEMMSMNEELQSSNEELETSKEELQSMNEELNTVNAELREKVQELESANNDMANLMNSTEVATVFLDADMAIRRFTPAAKQLFNLILSDVGRPIADLAMRFSDDELQHHAADVLETLVPSSKEVITNDGRWYTRRILPFRTQDRQVDGLVLTFSDVTELKEKEITILNSEEQLKQKNQLLAAVLEHTHMMAVYLDPQFNFRWVNKAYANTCNHEPSFFPGKNHFDLYPHEENRAIFQKVVDTGEPYFVAAKPFEFPDQPERGVTYWDWSLIPTRDSNESIDGLVFTLAEVTDRIRAEQALQENEERFHQLFDNMSSGVAVYEATRNGESFIFRDFNKAAEKIDNIKREELIGKDVASVFPEIGEFGLLDVFQRVWRTGVPEPFPIALYEDDRIEGWRDNYVYKLPSGEIVAIYDDISQQKKADEKIKFQSKLLESVGQSVIAADAHGKINYWNKVAEQTYGWSAEEAIGEDVTKLTMVPQGKPFMELVSNGNAWSDEVEALCKDGRRVPVLFSNTPIVNEDGCLMGIVSVSSDLTDRKKMEKKVRNAQKMEAIGTLAGGIAHDFNNILTAIIGNTELALFEAAKGTQIEENLQEILSSGMRAKELIKQILALSRHSVNIDKPFPIGPLVKEALQMLRSVIPTSIEFRENITSEQLVVKADPTQIHQVVVNLATNAKQAMTNGFGVLEIRLERVDFDEDVRSLHPEIGPGKYARISVSDTGCGIPEEDLGKIFEPYFTTKGNEIGTGMGLSVVHGNVRKSNGHIIVDSEVGKGTTFHVYLPLVEKAEPVYTSETIESIPKGVESILFVDDEPTIVKMQKQRLEHLGYKVTVKSNPLEAIEMFRSSPDQFDLVITDMTMPKMTGDKLSMEIKAIRSGVPVIMCTGFSEKIEGKNEDLDIDAILMKPTDLSLMATTIRKLLDGARLKTR